MAAPSQALAADARRLAVLSSYGILDTPPEPEYQDLAALASYISGCPTAWIGFADAGREWLKARVGLSATEIPREEAWWQGPVLSGLPLVVEDTATDPRAALPGTATSRPIGRFYAGVPLATSHGDPVGSISVAAPTPRTLSAEQLAALHALARQVVALLELRRAGREAAPGPAGPAAAAAEAELRAELAARERLMTLLRAVSRGSVAVGEAFFPAFVQHLAAGLAMRYVFVAECLDADRTRVRTLAYWRDDHLADPVEFAVEGTPCAGVMEGQTCVFERDLARRFPRDTPLAAMGAESYIGLPLLDPARRVIGHLAVMGTETLTPDPVVQAVLEVFAARAAAELERVQAERVRRALVEELEQARNRLHAENAYLRREIARQDGFDEIVGRSQAVQRTLRQIEQVAPTDSTVLITGETGTGKELIARAIHAHGPRRLRPLVAVNCGAISPQLVESELFGHEKGAFTGATSRRIGRFEVADGGTIFLDEIGDLSLDAQVRLLRVLENGEITRVGSSQPVQVDVRVIAATHRDLSAAVRQGAFRQDLYYRLNVFPIKSPSLRERREDIPLLVEHFVARYGARLGKRVATIPPAALNALMAYPWPGNIRELANVIERSMIVTTGPVLQLADWITGTYEPVAQGGAGLTLEALERQHIVRTLERSHWKVSGPGGAAEALNLKPTTLEARMKKLGISRPRPGSAG